MSRLEAGHHEYRELYHKYSDWQREHLTLHKKNDPFGWLAEAAETERAERSDKNFGGKSLNRKNKPRRKKRSARAASSLVAPPPEPALAPSNSKTRFVGLSLPELSSHHSEPLLAQPELERAQPELERAQPEPVRRRNREPAGVAARRAARKQVELQPQLPSLPTLAAPPTLGELAMGGAVDMGSIGSAFSKRDAAIVRWRQSLAVEKHTRVNRTLEPRKTKPSTDQQSTRRRRRRRRQWREEPVQR
eukprot:SAG11_NODE_635_length_8040_cov_3.233472_5_plen_247_part_00